MTMTSGIKWEIVRGINERMVSDFFRSLFLSESELSMEGIVQMLLDGNRDIEALALSAFVAQNDELFKQYAKEITGSVTGISTSSKNAVRQFIDDMNLHESYNQFYAEHLDEWNDSHDKDVIREEIVSERLVPIFENTRQNNLYIYRESDFYAIHLTRLLLNQ